MTLDDLGRMPIAPGPYSVRRAARSDNTGGYDWAVIVGKAVLAETYEHVGQKGGEFVKFPAESHARLMSLAPLIPELVEALQETMIDIDDADKNGPGYRLGTKALAEVESAIRGWPAPETREGNHDDA